MQLSASKERRRAKGLGIFGEMGVQEESMSIHSYLKRAKSGRGGHVLLKLILILDLLSRFQKG